MNTKLALKQVTELSHTRKTMAEIRGQIDLISRTARSIHQLETMRIQLAGEKVGCRMEDSIHEEAFCQARHVMAEMIELVSESLLSESAGVLSKLDEVTGGAV